MNWMACRSVFGLALFAIGGQACDASGGAKQTAPVVDDITQLPKADVVGSPQDAAAGPDSNSAPSTNFNLAEMALSGSRLNVRGYKSADGAVLPTLGFWDSKLNVWCNAQAAADGKVRCLPPAATGYSYFADQNCTEPAFLNGLSSFWMGETKYAAIAGSTIACGGGVLEYYNLGEVVPVASIYSKTGDKCMPLSPEATASAACYTYHRQGEKVPLSDFAEIEIVELK